MEITVVNKETGKQEVKTYNELIEFIQLQRRIQNISHAQMARDMGYNSHQSFLHYEKPETPVNSEFIEKQLSLLGFKLSINWNII